MYYCPVLPSIVRAARVTVFLQCMRPPLFSLFVLVQLFEGSNRSLFEVFYCIQAGSLHRRNFSRESHSHDMGGYCKVSSYDSPETWKNFSPAKISQTRKNWGSMCNQLVYQASSSLTLQKSHFSRGWEMSWLDRLAVNWWYFTHVRVHGAEEVPEGLKLTVPSPDLV